MPRQYSRQKCQALREYQQRTSVAQALAVCVFTPLPALVYTLAVDALLPLAPVAQGWSASPTLAIRFFVSSSVIAFCMMNLMRRVLPELQVTPQRFMLPAAATGALYCGLVVTVAELWVFPLPFMTATTSGAFTCFCGFSIYVFIGAQPFRAVPDYRRRLTVFIVQLFLLNVVNFVYVSYGAFYRTQEGVIKAVVLCFPIAIKMLTKTLTARIVEEIVPDDFLPEILQFSVELLHSIFVTTCVQTSSDPTQVTLLLLVFDFLPLWWVYRQILRVARGDTKVQSSSRSMIRIHPHSSPKSSKLSRVHIRPPPRKPSESTLAAEDVVLRRALYACENHLLIEYIECITPSVYAIYVGGLFFLPNARYYNLMDSISNTSRLAKFMANVGLLVLLQLASVVGFGVVLSRRVLPSVSALHQLSFVLETQHFMVQCWLCAWIPFCILATVQHNGMDFTLHFAWIHHSQ